MSQNPPDPEHDDQDSEPTSTAPDGERPNGPQDDGTGTPPVQEAPD